MKPYIALTLGTRTVTLDFLIGDRYPRIKTGRPTERSQYGALIRKGFSYLPPHTWQFSAMILPETSTQLDAIYAEYDRLKDAGQDPKILVIDTTQLLTEASPRTRGKAPAPFNAESNPFASDVSYFATFWAEFTAAIEYSDRGRFVVAQIALEESDQKTAP